MKKQFTKLIKVKSIITILLTLTFCYLTIVGKLSTEFLTIYTTVIAFYFGTQKVREDGNETNSIQ